MTRLLGHVFEDPLDLIDFAINKLGIVINGFSNNSRANAQMPPPTPHPATQSIARGKNSDVTRNTDTSDPIQQGKLEREECARHGLAWRIGLSACVCPSTNEVVNPFQPANCKVK